MKLRNNFTGVARLLGTSLWLTCLTLHMIIKSMTQYLYLDQNSLKISNEGETNDDGYDIELSRVS